MQSKADRAMRRGWEVAEVRDRMDAEEPVVEIMDRLLESGWSYRESEEIIAEAAGA